MSRSGWLHRERPPHLRRRSSAAAAAAEPGKSWNGGKQAAVSPFVSVLFTARLAMLCAPSCKQRSPKGGSIRRRRPRNGPRWTSSGMDQTSTRGHSAAAQHNTPRTSRGTRAAWWRSCGSSARLTCGCCGPWPRRRLSQREAKQAGSRAANGAQPHCNKRAITQLGGAVARILRSRPKDTNLNAGSTLRVNAPTTGKKTRRTHTDLRSQRARYNTDKSKSNEGTGGKEETGQQGKHSGSLC